MQRGSVSSPLIAARPTPASSKSPAPASIRSATRSSATTPGPSRFSVSCSHGPRASGARRDRLPTSIPPAGHEVDEIGARDRRRARGARRPRGQSFHGLPDGDVSDSGHAIWIVSHKPVAVEAGLGHMGIHRNLIHPKFGNFVLLGTVLLDRRVGASTTIRSTTTRASNASSASPPARSAPSALTARSTSRPASPTTIASFLGGFSDWVEQVADARDALDYRRRISEPETASMWQSLSHGANYKSAYCMAVCPAGEDVIGPYLHDRQRHLTEVVQAAAGARRAGLCRARAPTPKPWRGGSSRTRR